MTGDPAAQSFEGVEAITEGFNPATWVLDITNQSQERRLAINFADEYERSELYRCPPPPPLNTRAGRSDSTNAGTRLRRNGSATQAHRQHGMQRAPLRAVVRRRTEVLVEELSVAPEGVAPLSFPTRYSRNFMSQFRVCLWKQHHVYWRSPQYNSVRFLFTFLLAILFGEPPPDPPWKALKHAVPASGPVFATA